MAFRAWFLLLLSGNVSAFLASRPIQQTTYTIASQRHGFRQFQSMRASEDVSLQENLGFQWNHKIAMGHLLVGASILLSGWMSSPTAAMALEPVQVPEDVTVLNHQYSDPLHPHCRRTIQVDKDGKTFHYSGTAVGLKDDPVLRGCSPAEIKKYGLRTGSFDGQIVMPGLRLSVGDGIHEGKWEPANSVTTPSLQFKAVDGIRWNDGNKWIVKDVASKPLTTVIGEWIFLAYIGFSTLAGVKGVVDKIQEKKNRATS